MPRKLSTYKCEVCGDEFETRSYPQPRSCSKKECRFLIKSITGKGRISADRWLTKKCLTCGKEFETRISREKTYCSNECSLISEERKINLSNKYTGKTLEERGWSKEAIEKDIKIKSKRNKEMVGKNYVELYPDMDKRNEYLKKLQEASTGDNNPMSYESLMERMSIDSYKEARDLMPATGRTGEKHPMYGKHHTIESKKKMINTMEEKGIFGRSSNGLFDGIPFQGTWELKYIINCKENNIPIKRFNLEPIHYIFEGNTHHYFPDFIINDKTIVEIKGMFWNKGVIKAKKIEAEKICDYLLVTDVNQNQNPKTFLKLTKAKYGDRFELKNNPYEETRSD